MNLETGSNAPSSELIQGLAVGKASIPKSIYAALRISRDKNKAVILDVYWDCGFLGVKDGSIKHFFRICNNFFKINHFFPKINVFR